LDNGTRLCLVNASSATKTFEDARKQKTVLGASQAGGSTRDYAYMLNNLAGTKFDIVSGYKGSAQILLAMQRGEVEGMCGYDWSSLKSARPEWIRDKKVNIVLQVGMDAEPTLSKMGVPQVWNYIADPKGRKAAELIVSQQIFNRPFVAPPGIPDDRLKALRDAFIATTNDSAFIKDASAARIDLQPLSGERVQKAVADLYASPPEIVQKAAEAMRPVPHT
jgi:tripartite-type tricarboxylate transporter receptor subunit TctC